MNAKDLPAFVKARPEQQPDFQPWIIEGYL
jgi:hypothetical protein